MQRLVLLLWLGCLPPGLPALARRPGAVPPRLAAPAPVLPNLPALRFERAYFPLGRISSTARHGISPQPLPAKRKNLDGSGSMRKVKQRQMYRVLPAGWRSTLSTSSQVGRALLRLQARYARATRQLLQCRQALARPAVG